MTDGAQSVFDALTAGDYAAAGALHAKVTDIEWQRGNALWAATLDVSRDHRERRVEVLAWLTRRSQPGETIETLVRRLTPSELDELDRLIDGEGSDDGTS